MRDRRGRADFAHDANERLVTGAHTGGWNSGNMGAALLGTFTTTNGVEPSPAAVDALETCSPSSRRGTG